MYSDRSICGTVTGTYVYNDKRICGRVTGAYLFRQEHMCTVTGAYVVQ